MQRTRPDRVLLHTFDTLSAEVARQALAEWTGWADDGYDSRRGACERIAILADLGRQQAAIELERATGEPTDRWSPRRNRRDLTDRLETATEANGPTLTPRTLHLIRTEVERPWTEYAARMREIR